MDTIQRNRIIDDALGKRRDRDMREKLRKLLNERKIPFLLPKNDMEFRKSIACGSFGIVDLVRYQKKLYAHKRARQNSNEQRNSILGEAIKLTDITQYHPNIQRLSFINLESLGFLMDYCDCGSLDSIVTNTVSTYTLVDVLHWVYQLADALSFLHSKNIMHRDVKMQNILLKDNYQTLVLTDYGTATDLGRSLLTNDVGTPIIMAPEVFSGTNYTEQCDIYSWSIVLWQLLSKQFSPYENQDKNRYHLMMKVVMEQLRPPELSPCPNLLIALMYRSWHSDPDERPTLFSIKKILRLLIHVLPKKEQTYSEELADEVKQQCINESKSLEKYFPHQPRSNNERSMNIYEEHWKKLKIISDRKQTITVLEEKLKEQMKHNQAKRDHFEELVEENKKLQEQIEELRSQKS